MKKKSPSQAGLFNPRALLAFALCSIGAGLGFLSFASTPSSGTLTDVSGPIELYGRTFFCGQSHPGYSSWTKVRSVPAQRSHAMITR
jgi:hypothetical protein